MGFAIEIRELQEHAAKGGMFKLKTGKSPVKISQIDHKAGYGLTCFYFYVSEQGYNDRNKVDEPVNLRGPRALSDFELYDGPTPKQVTITVRAPQDPKSLYNSLRGANEITIGLRNPFTDEPIEMEIPMADLYQTKDEPARFGTPLLNAGGQPMKNSIGLLILEMKGEGGKIETFKPEDIELVTPYTISLQQLTAPKGENGVGSTVHVVGKPGQVEKDQVLLELSSGLLWRVVELDSKCRSPKENKSRWLMVPTQKVVFGESE